MAVRITAVSPMALIVDPLRRQFADVWPEAALVQMLDEGLYNEFHKTKQLTPVIGERVSRLLHYAADCGAQGIVFTGSVFGDAVRSARADMDIPVLTVFEAMIEQAFAAGSRLGVITTSDLSMAEVKADIATHASEHGLDYTLTENAVVEARQYILDGDTDTHDAMVVDAANAMTGVDAIVFGQFSLGTARDKVPDVPGRAALGAGRSAAEWFRERLEG